MRAIIKDDRILQPSPTGIDVGPKPPKISINDLRYNGKRLVNMNNLNEIWVEQVNGIFVLHCKKYRNSQLVQMQYKDRKHLINDNGTFRIRTQDEINQILIKRTEDERKANKRTKLRKQIGDQFDREQDLEKLLHILMKVVIDGDSDSKKFLQDYLDSTLNLVQLEKDKMKLLENATKKDRIYKTDEGQV